MSSKTLSSWWRRLRRHSGGTPASAPRACVEALVPRTLLSVGPAMAQRLLDAGYEKVIWKGHETYAEPGQWIVSLRGVRGNESTQLAGAAARVRKAAPRAALRVVDHLGRDGLFRVDAPAGARFKDVRAALGRVAGVQFAEPNFAVWAQGVEARGVAEAQNVVTPDDPSFRFQWGLDNPGAGGVADADIDAPEAWGITTGTPDHDFVVGVIDTGVDYNHPDLRDNMWVNVGETGVDEYGQDKAANEFDDDGNGYADDVHGYDFANLDGQPLDDHNHGTHVAGIIAASADDGAGVAGLAWNARIMALRFLSADGFGGIGSAVEALDYAVMMKSRGVDVRLTNNSWGSAEPSEAMAEAIRRSRDAGMLFVAAAGNGGDDRIGDDVDVPGNAFYPANEDVENVISVTATDASDRLGTFSNYGASGVDLAAPGVGIYSTVRNGGYIYFNGTSMAAPLVSATAVLAFSLKPSATWQEVRDAIYGGVDKVPALAGKTVTGGRLNAYGTLRRLQPPAVVDRHVFYNNSAFDGRSAAAGKRDDDAVAGDKAALLPGQTATFANYTSYSKGINGVMVDVRNLPAGGGLTAADFAFSVGTDADLLQSWEPAPEAASVTVRRGDGVDGADRVTITFADGAVKDAWLRVKVLATANTGLSEPDVFYFGNAVGETGNSPADARVNALDAAVVRSRLAAAPASLSSRYDLNRDGRVGATDLLIARTSRPTTPLPLITLPVP